MIEAKIIADSKNEFGNRITTLIVTMPRYILAEFNTHRMLSKNSASSRAIPFEKNLESVKNNPFIPIAFMKDHKGMQGTEYFSSKEDILTCKDIWNRSKDSAITNSTFLAGFGITKQLANRLLEPFMWHTVIVTGTEWENFFALRCPKYSLYKHFEPATNYEFRSIKDAIKAIAGNDSSHAIFSWNQLDWLKANKGQADIHMMATAEAIWDAMNESSPKELKAGEWHIPFGDKIKIEAEIAVKTKSIGISTEISYEKWIEEYMSTYAIKISTACCARVSYTVIGEDEKQSNHKKDCELHDKLTTSGHWSPFEHCAKSMSKDEHYDNALVCSPYIDKNNNEINIREAGISGNFKGFIQYRKTFNNENITKELGGQ